MNSLCAIVAFFAVLAAVHGSLLAPAAVSVKSDSAVTYNLDNQKVAVPVGYYGGAIGPYGGALGHYGGVLAPAAYGVGLAKGGVGLGYGLGLANGVVGLGHGIGLANGVVGLGYGLGAVKAYGAYPALGLGHAW